MENKLIEEIEIDVKSYINFEISRELLIEKLFTLTSDVAADFSVFANTTAWYDDDVDLWNLNDESADPFRYTTKEYFTYFIEFVWEK